MTVTYSVTVRNNRLQQVVNAIDGGAGSGQLRIGTAGMGAILSTIVLNKPCGTISGGVLTFSTSVALVDASAAAAGTAGAAIITDSTGTTVVSDLTVGISGTDLILSNTSISLGDIVSLTSGTITGN